MQNRIGGRNMVEYCRQVSTVGLLLVFASYAGATVMPVGNEFQVNSYTTGYQSDSSIAISRGKDFVVVWSSEKQDDPSYSGIYGQRYINGAPVGIEFHVNTFTGGFQWRASVAADSAGDFVVVWQSGYFFGGTQDGDLGGVFGQRYASDGSATGSEFQINSYTVNDQHSPRVASDADGDFVVVWVSTQPTGSFDGIFARRYASTGAPIGTEFRVNTYTPGVQGEPAVASDAAGNVVVVWEDQFDQDGSDFGVFGQRYDSGGNPSGTEFQVNTYTPGPQGYPAVSSDSNGDFAVVWTSGGFSAAQDGSGGGVFAQRYASSGNPSGTEFQVNAYTSSQQADAAVAMDPSGNFVVTWNSFTPPAGLATGFDVFARRYGNDGSALGDEFQINTYTTDNQSAPQVGVDNAGGFVVTWTGQGQDDGTDGGVFAQVYADRVCPLSPDTCITSFGKGLLISKEDPGKEKFIAKIIHGPSVPQIDFGDPLAGGTAYALCIYDDLGALAGELKVDRAGQSTCSGGSTQCWKPIGPEPPAGKGYKYKDTDRTASGVSLMLLNGTGSAKIVVKGKGANLPLPIAQPLTNATSVTLQLRGDNAPFCFGVSLTHIVKSEGLSFKAK